MKYIVYTLLLIQLLFANENLTGQEQSVFDQSNSSPAHFVQSKKDYFQEVITEELESAKSLYVSYIYFPKIIYKNQRFEIDVKALVTNGTFDRLETRFIDSLNMQVLNPDSSWKKIDNNTFKNKFYFKASETQFKLPTFQVIIYKDGFVKEIAYLKPDELTFSEIAKNDKKFSNVIAKSLKINTYKTKQYNNNELITILDIESMDSNLEDFYIQSIEEQGISSISDTYPLQKVLYYLVVPVHTKVIEFKYYSLLKNRLETIKVPIVLEEGLVSTQTDLNPNKSNLLFYKRVLFSALTVCFVGLFVWKRKYIFLILALVMLIIFILLAMPNKVSYIKNNSVVYILPTKNSTIFFKTEKTNRVEVVSKKDDFIKIMFELNGKSIIGWVKEENIVKN